MNTYVIIASAYSGGFESTQLHAESIGKAEEAFMREIAHTLWNDADDDDRDGYTDFETWYENCGNIALPTIDFIIEIPGEHAVNINECF